MRTLGSSDVPVILGLAPWADASPHKVWTRLLGLTDYEQRDNDAQLVGHAMEAGLLTVYTRRTELVALPGPSLDEPGIPGPEPWMHSRPDGVVLDSLEPRMVGRVVEVKTCGVFDAQWGEDGSDKVPPHYLVQCIWHMACCDVDVCDLVALAVRYRQLRIFTIRRDPAVEKAIINRARAWYQRHVEQRVPPPIGDDGDAARRALALAYAGAEPRAVKATPEVRTAVAQYRDARAAVKGWERIKDRAAATVCAYMQDADELVDGDRTIATWRPTRPRRWFDLEALRADHPDVADKYTRTGKPGRTFRTKEST